MLRLPPQTFVRLCGSKHSVTLHGSLCIPMFSALDSFRCLRLQVHLLAREHTEVPPFSEERNSRLPIRHWMERPLTLSLMLQPALNGPRVLLPGESWSFGMTLLDRSAEWLPAFVNTVRRLGNVLRFHCELSDSGPVKSIITRARQVHLAEDDTRWYDWERHSHRQRRKMRLWGLIGEALYEGNLGPLAPYLAVGTCVNVGKGTSFGLGGFEVEPCAG